MTMGTGTLLLDADDPRMVADPSMTIGDFCQKAIEGMLEGHTDAETITVLYKGGIYYLNMACMGMKPPYQMIETDAREWFGQREN